MDYKTRHVHDIFSQVLSLSVHCQWFYEYCGTNKWFVVLRSWSCSKYYGKYAGGLLIGSRLLLDGHDIHECMFQLQLHRS